MPYIVGLDIGGTKCAVLLADVKHGIKIIDKIRFATDTDKGFEQTKNNLFGGVRKIINRNQIDIDKIKAIGVSCGGPLDSKNGIILSPPNLPGWDNIHITDILKEEFKVPVFLQNDANACALVEWKMGAGKGTEDMIFLTMGTGMGAGIIAGGKLITGVCDMAGEVGHIRLEDDGPEGYGKIGSFEGFCSGGGIARLARSMVEKWIDEGKTISWCGSKAGLKDIDARLVSENAKSGDKYAVKIFEEVGHKLGKAISILMDIFNPEVIVIGSIFGRSEELLRKPMEEVINKEVLGQTKNACKVAATGTGEAIGDYASIMAAVYELGINIDEYEEKDEEVLRYYDRLFQRYPQLAPVRSNIMDAYCIIASAYQNGGKLLICGNGGSAADSDHIVGELMKGFFKARPVAQNFAGNLNGKISEKLQGALPAISLTMHNALSTAYLNDVSPEMVFAQQVYGYGNGADVLLAISTSGNSKNVVNAALTAKAKGIKVISLTGPGGGKLKELSDVLINVPGSYTSDIQELHLPVYHTICAMLEEKFF